jgi:hypothetical protein
VAPCTAVQDSAAKTETEVALLEGDTKAGAAGTVATVVKLRLADQEPVPEAFFTLTRHRDRRVGPAGLVGVPLSIAGARFLLIPTDPFPFRIRISQVSR